MDSNYNNGSVKSWLLIGLLSIAATSFFVLGGIFIYSSYFQRVDIGYNTSKYKIALVDPNILNSYISDWLSFNNPATNVWQTLPQPEIKQTAIHKVTVNFVDSQATSFQVSIPSVKGNVISFSSFVKNGIIYIFINPESSIFTPGIDTDKVFSEAVVQSIFSVLKPDNGTGVNSTLTEMGNIHRKIQNSEKPIFTIRKI